jgi:serine protease Do
MDLMQISVPTNHGSSGGGLYNLYGELIGITNAGNDSYTALNFAIPYELSNGNGYLAIATELLGTSTATNYGYIIGRRERFGFTSSLTTNSLGGTYLTVSEVVKGSQAELSGMKVGDIIVSVTLPDGITVNVVNNNQLTEAFGKVKIGESVNVTLATEDWRGLRSEYTVKLNCKQFRFCNTGN